MLISLWSRFLMRLFGTDAGHSVRKSSPLRRSIAPRLEPLEKRALLTPHVLSIDRSVPASATTNSATVTYVVKFDQSVTGVDPTDFSIATSGTVGTVLIQVAPIAGSGGAAYTVTISGVTGQGTLGLNLADDGSIRDLNGNPLVQTNATATFQDQVTFGTNASPHSVVAADVNGDGRPDLLVADRDNNYAAVLIGNGDGTFQPPATLATGAGPRTVVVADVNGDGRPDLLVPNFDDSNVSVLLGNGDGSFQDQTTFATDSGPFDVAVMDVNGDRLPDLVVANIFSNDVSVLLGNGDGTFQGQSTFATGVNPKSVETADINGDGQPDLLVANYRDDTVSVLQGNGDGTFQDQVTFATGSSPISVVAADVNGDGRLDMVVADSGSGDVSILAGNGDGTFQDGVTFAAGIKPVSVSVADVNGDGRPDLLVANFTYDYAGVLLGNGDGSFQDPFTFDAGTAPYAAAISDVNGDGRPDLVVANGLDDNVSVILNSGNGDFTGEVYTIDPTARNIAPQVLSIDRSNPASANITGGSVVFTVTFSELVTGVDAGDFALARGGTVGAATPVIVSPSGPAAVYTVQVDSIVGTGTLGLNLADDGSIHDLDGNPLVASNTIAAFQNQMTLATAGDPVSIAESDVNGDGQPDLISANSLGFSAGVFLGNGDGTFQDQATFGAGFVPESVVAADVNGDGRIDLVLANYYSRSISVLLGNGDGTFAPRTTFAARRNPAYLAVGDVNGDGRPDLALANYYDGKVSVLLGNGDGTFQSPTASATGVYPNSVHISDVNGDGKPDLVVANYYDNTVSVLLGNGDGTFQAQSATNVGYGPHSLAVEDVNGDGIPDLIVGNFAEDTVSVLLGNGDSTFQPQTSFSTGAGPSFLVLEDVNGDGQADIVVSNRIDANIGVLLGNGDGTFQSQVTFAAGFDPLYLAAGDLNGDGRPDVSVANSGDDTVGVLLNDRAGGDFAGQAYTVTAPAGGGGGFVIDTTLSILAPEVTVNSNATVVVVVTPGFGTVMGNVDLVVDGGYWETHGPLQSGSASFVLPALSLGDHRLSATFVAQNGFAASSASGTLHVAPLATTIDLAAPAITYNADGSATVTITSPAGTPSGDVTISMDGGTAVTQPLDDSGQAKFSLGKPTVGKHALFASFAAQGNFGASNIYGSLQVNGAPLSVTAGDQAITYSQSLPVNSVQFAGFLPGDSSAGLSGTLSFTYEDAFGAVVDSPVNVGTYKIIPGGLTSTNYAIDFVPGTLTIRVQSGADFVAASGSSGSQTKLFLMGLDEQVYTQTLDASGIPRDSSQLAAPGQVNAIQAVNPASGSPLLLVIGFDGQVYEQQFDAAGAPLLTARNPTGGYFLTKPAQVKAISATVTSAGNPLIAAIGLDDQVYAQQLDGNGQPAAGYGPTRAGQVLSIVARGNSVFVLGLDHQVYETDLTAGAAEWSSYRLVAAGQVKEFGDSSAGGLFVIKTDDLLNRQAFITGNNPPGQYVLPQLANARPVLFPINSFSQPPGFTPGGAGGLSAEVFAIGLDSQIYFQKFLPDGTSDGGYAAASPGAVISDLPWNLPGLPPLLFVVGLDSQIYEQAFDASGNASGGYVPLHSGVIR